MTRLANPAMRLAIVAAFLVVFGIASSVAYAQGLVVSRDRIPPERLEEQFPRNLGVNIKAHEVTIEVKDQVATTKIRQVFHNPQDFWVEGQYLFPLPSDAAIKEFAMSMNGAMVSGEMLPADQARSIYEGIVRSMRDPGLLEYVGRNLFRAKVFPIAANDDTVIELSFSQLLPAENGVVRYTYPLNTSRYHDAEIENVLIQGSISSQIPLKTMYSPSHDLEIIRNGENAATIGYEGKNIKPDRDLVLYYTTSADDIGLSLVTQRDVGEDGYFVMLVSPKQEYAVEEIDPKDILFVVDTSGSMAEDRKMEQAKEALKYCLDHLNPHDRFNIVPFSTEARRYRDELVPASAEYIESATRYVNELRARGGTAINDALKAALELVPTDSGNERMCMIVFMTDGLPTVGERQVAKILENVKTDAKANVRLFSFGVGYDVNTHLLDKLAENNRGTRAYIDPSQDIETEVASFYTKVSSPVFSNLELVLGNGAAVYDVMHPAGRATVGANGVVTDLPDLFEGQQIVITGRYSGIGDEPVFLRGVAQGEQKEFTYEVKWPEHDLDASSIPHVWAVRKVGFMLDQIRLYGHSEELEDEIVRLGVRFGIVTPYTSFLITEDTPGATTGRGDGFGGGGPEDGENDDGQWRQRRLGEATRNNPNAPPQPQSDSNAAEAPDPLNPNGARPGNADRDALEDEANDERQQSGAGAVARSESLRMLREADSLEEMERAMGGRHGGGVAPRNVAGRTFIYRSAVWVDTTYEPATMAENIRVIEAFSDEYFNLIDEVPAITQYLSVGDCALIAIDGQAYYILDSESYKLYMESLEEGTGEGEDGNGEGSDEGNNEEENGSDD